MSKGDPAGHSISGRCGAKQGGNHHHWRRQQGSTEGDQLPPTLTFRGEERKVLQEIRDDQRGGVCVWSQTTSSPSHQPPKDRAVTVKRVANCITT